MKLLFQRQGFCFHLLTVACALKRYSHLAVTILEAIDPLGCSDVMTRDKYNLGEYKEGERTQEGSWVILRRL